MLQNRADLLEPLTAHVTWIVLLAHSWSLHGLNKIVNRFLGLAGGMGAGWCDPHQTFVLLRTPTMYSRPRS
ncbi:hypothetical protein DXO397_02115, partial [Xanthomonas oryzae pv. oryzae]